MDKRDPSRSRIIHLTRREVNALRAYLALGQSEVGQGGWSFDDDTPEIIEALTERLANEEDT